MQHQETYRIMGIDPGTNYMGYGVLEIEGRNVRSVVLGDIDLHKLTDPYAKLRYIFERVGALIDQYAPREVALESPFFGENVQSMLKLGRAQGVATALGDERVKGLGGGKKAASKRGSQSWEKFLKDHPDRELK